MGLGAGLAANHVVGEQFGLYFGLVFVLRLFVLGSFLAAGQRCRRECGAGMEGAGKGKDTHLHPLWALVAESQALNLKPSTSFASTLHSLFVAWL